MNSKIYLAITNFTQYLESAENCWKNNEESMQCKALDIKSTLAGLGFGGTNQEVCDTLLRFAALIITESPKQDDYPTLNFLDTADNAQE